jgi:hypothetical protein
LSRLPAAHLALRSAVSLVVLLGLVRLARNRRRRDVPAWVHGLGTLGIFAIWPWNMILDRFLLCLFPMVLLAFFVGVRNLAGRLGAGRVLTWISFLAVIVGGDVLVSARAVSLLHSADGQRARAVEHESLEAILDAIRGRLEPDAVVAAYWPETVSLYTGRQAVPLIENDNLLIGRCDDPDRLKLWMAAAPGRPFYLLIRARQDEYHGIDLMQEAAFARDPALVLRTVFSSPDGRFRLVSIRESRVKPPGCNEE